MTWTEVLRERVEAANDDRTRLVARLDLAAWLADTDPRASVGCAEEALAAAERLGDAPLLARARCVRGHSKLRTDGPRAARDILDEAREAYAVLRDEAGMAWCDVFGGIALEYLGDPGGATITSERALAAFRALGDVRGEARALNTLGAGTVILGRIDDGLALLQRSGELAVQAHDRVTIGLAWLNAAEVRSRIGIRSAGEGRTEAAGHEFTAALAELRAVHRHAVRTGFIALEPAALAYQVVPLVRLGRPAEAVEVGEQAVARAGALDIDDAAAPALHHAGLARLAAGDLTGAVAHLQHALALYEQWDLTHETVAVLAPLVEAYERLDDVPSAFALHKRLLAATLRLRDDIAEREDRVTAARFEAEQGLDPDDPGRELRQLARTNRRLVDRREEMQRLAHTDALTGLANRRHFDAQLSRLMVQAGLSGAELSLVLVDIDHFKQINDRHTHLVGDAVLRELATEIRRHCRVSDLAARIGGEEFVVLLPDSGYAQAYAVAERLRSSVEALDLDRLAPGLRITVSAGAATSHRGGSAEELLADADAALYAAKRAGRNRVVGARDTTA